LYITLKVLSVAEPLVSYPVSEGSQSQSNNEDEPMPLVPYSDSEGSQSQPDVIQYGGQHQQQQRVDEGLDEPPSKRARLDDPTNRQRDKPLPLPIRDYYDLEGPVTKRVIKFRIDGQAYTIKFKNYDKMVDLERILIEIFRQVRMF
jgi:hypothetical protein